MLLGTSLWYRFDPCLDTDDFEEKVDELCGAIGHLEVKDSPSAEQPELDQAQGKAVSSEEYQSSSNPPIRGRLNTQWLPSKKTRLAATMREVGSDEDAVKAIAHTTARLEEAIRKMEKMEEQRLNHNSQAMLMLQGALAAIAIVSVSTLAMIAVLREKTR